MKNIIITSALLLFVFVSSFAQIDRTNPPAPGPAPDIQISDFESFELDNGLKVFIVENHKIPRVAYSISFNYEPILEKENAGMVGIAGQLIGTATESRTKEQLDEEIDFIGASINAGSSSAYAAGLKKHNEKILELMSDIVLNSSLKQEELDKIKTQTLSGLQAAKNDPNSISDALNSVILFGKEHPYGELETEKSVESITLEMCQDFYKKYYKPNIAYMAIVGNITKKEAEPLIKKYFGEWEKGDVPEYKYEPKENPAENKVVLFDRNSAVQSVIKIGYPVDLKVGSEDYIKASVMNTILGGGTYRLFHNLRETHGWTYGAYSRLSSNRLIGNFGAFTSVRNEVTDSAVYEILAEIKKLRTDKVPEEELQRVKNYLSGNFALSLERPETVARFALNIERYNLPADYYKNYLKNLNAVSSDDVFERARKYMRPENAYIFIVGKSEEIAEKLARFDVDNKIEYIDEDGNYYDPETAAKELPSDLTALDVINKYIEAIGGKEKLDEVTSLHASMKMTVQGMQLDVNQYVQEPGKMAMTVAMGPNVMQKQVVNGDKGSMTAMGQTKELTGDELARYQLQTYVSLESKYEELGFKTELKSISKVDGKETYVVEVTSPQGDLMTDYYEVETGLKLKSEGKVEMQGSKIQQVTNITEYKEFGGIKFATKVNQAVNQQSFEINVENIEINPEIEEAIFEL
jgi:predicted Zn-dependent peptidase